MKRASIKMISCLTLEGLIVQLFHPGSWLLHQSRVFIQWLSHIEKLNSLVDGLSTRLGASAVPVYHQNRGGFWRVPAPLSTMEAWKYWF